MRWRNIDEAGDDADNDDDVDDDDVDDVDFNHNVDDDDDDDDDVDNVSSAVDMNKLMQAGGGGILRISNIGPTHPAGYFTFRVSPK